MMCVTITVSGPTGSGKSRILAEIEIALRARGVTVTWADTGDQRDVNSEHWAEAHGGWQPELPKCVLQEINTRQKYSTGATRFFNKYRKSP